MKTIINGEKVAVGAYGIGSIYAASHICSRGRKYQTSVVGHQAGHTGKMISRFTPEAVKTRAGIKAIKVNIARHFWDSHGYSIDKMSVAESIAFYDANIEVMRQEPITIVGMFAGVGVSREQMEAFFKVSITGFGVIDNDEPTGMVIASDGSCSGIQFASAITRDATMAASVNIAGSAFRNDIYIDVVTYVIEKVNSSDGYTDSVIAIINDPAKFNRGSVKFPVMSVSYGSKYRSIMRHVKAAFKGEAFDDIKVIAKLINDARGVYTKPAIRMMRIFQAINKAVLANGNISTYTHSDGFVYTNAKPLEKSGYIVAGRNDDQRSQSAIAPDLIHSFDAAHVRAVVNACDFEVISIHDSFGCHPDNFERMNVVIREQFAKMFDGNRNVIREFFEENKAKMSSEDAKALEIKVAAFKFGTLDVSTVMDNEFAWS